MRKPRIRGTFEEQQSIDAGVADDVEVGGGTAARRGMRMCSAKDSRGAHVRKRVRCLVRELPPITTLLLVGISIQDLDGGSALSWASIGSVITSLTDGVWMPVGECHLSSQWWQLRRTGSPAGTAKSACILGTNRFDLMLIIMGHTRYTYTY
jgi:hypothetical protein